MLKKPKSSLGVLEPRKLNAGVSSVDARGQELLMPTVPDLSLQVGTEKRDLLGC